MFIGFGGTIFPEQTIQDRRNMKFDRIDRTIAIFQSDYRLGFEWAWLLDLRTLERSEMFAFQPCLFFFLGSFGIVCNVYLSMANDWILLNL